MHAACIDRTVHGSDEHWTDGAVLGDHGGRPDLALDIERQHARDRDAVRVGHGNHVSRPGRRHMRDADDGREQERVCLHRRPGAVTTPPRLARLDPQLAATVVSRRKLTYRAGANATLDRPAHIRAGSSLAWLGGSLIVVQDDANFIAIVDPATGLAEAITLPAGEGGLRQFDDARGNKKFKLDLEACCMVPGPNGPRLIAFGSGSKKRRRSVLVLDHLDRPEPGVSVVDASALYIGLEAAVDFAGSDMNIEGAAAFPDTIRLFGRGNGQSRHGRVALKPRISSANA